MRRETHVKFKQQHGRAYIWVCMHKVRSKINFNFISSWGGWRFPFSPIVFLCRCEHSWQSSVEFFFKLNTPGADLIDNENICKYRIWKYFYYGLYLCVVSTLSQFLQFHTTLLGFCELVKFIGSYLNILILSPIFVCLCVQ